jgi:hypothetical protein
MTRYDPHGRRIPSEAELDAERLRKYAEMEAEGHTFYGVGRQPQQTPKQAAQQHQQEQLKRKLMNQAEKDEYLLLHKLPNTMSHKQKMDARGAEMVLGWAGQMLGEGKMTPEKYRAVEAELHVQALSMVPMERYVELRNAGVVDHVLERSAETGGRDIAGSKQFRQDCLKEVVRDYLETGQDSENIPDAVFAERMKDLGLIDPAYLTPNNEFIAPPNRSAWTFGRDDRTRTLTLSLAICWAYLAMNTPAGS